ncbi:MAG TPA: formyltransferase family protein, partial [Rubrivivax sp.]|nr:formyltransferase family protein [Rubrivivax sp.]
MHRNVILVSGRGSNMAAEQRRCVAEGWPARVVAVVANRAEAGALAHAAAQGIATAVVDHRAH